MIESKLIEYIKWHQLLEQGKTVVVGVSGGPDSMALLSFLNSIRSAWDLTLIALSVEHGLRGQVSLDDLSYVEQMCEEWEIAFEGTSVDVASYKKAHQVGTQVAARELRYSFFREQMEKHQADYLALGHHADDQLETMLMNLARSSTPEALSGIPIRRTFATGMIIRPFLCVTREEIEAYCQSKGIVPRRDASNEDIKYTRNAVRKKISPLIKELNPNVHRGLQHLSTSLMADAEYLAERTRKMVDSIVTFNPDKQEAFFDVKTFKSYPSALQRRAFHLILNHLYHETPKNVSYIHEENFFNLLKQNGGHKKLDLPEQVQVTKSYLDVTFHMADNDSNSHPFRMPLTIPGETILPDDSKLIAKEVSHPDFKGKYTYICNHDHIDFPLYVRTRKSGDRMGWKGLHGHKKLKDIFIDYKVPLSDRDGWPIVTDDNDQILWLIGLKKNQVEQLSTATSYIQLTYEKVKGEHHA